MVGPNILRWIVIHKRKKLKFGDITTRFVNSSELSFLVNSRLTYSPSFRQDQKLIIFAASSTHDMTCMLQLEGGVILIEKRSRFCIKNMFVYSPIISLLLKDIESSLLIVLIPFSQKFTVSVSVQLNLFLSYCLIVLSIPMLLIR